MKSLKLALQSLLICGTLGSSYAQTVPHTFTPGAVIRASELNDNFRALASSTSNNNSSANGRIRVVDTRTKRVLGALLDMDVGGSFLAAYAVLTPSNYIWLIPDDRNYDNGADVAIDSSQWLDFYFAQPNCAGASHVIPSTIEFLRSNYNNVVISNGTQFLYIRGDRALNIFEAKSYQERGTKLCKPLSGVNQSPSNPGAPNTTRFHTLFSVTDTSDFSGIPAAGTIGIELAY